MYCLNCNKITSKWGAFHKKYCNIKCKYEYDNKKSRLEFSPLNCQFCETEFIPKNKTQKNCSKCCREKFEGRLRSKKTGPKECSVCKKSFIPYTSLDKFCSANCRIENMKSKRSFKWSEESVKKRIGKNNPGYVHGGAIRGVKKDSTGLRLFRKNRDEYKNELTEKNGCVWCEKCGKTGVRFETHHIIYRSEKPSHTNLHDKINMIILCVPCHNDFHMNKPLRNDLVEKRKLNEIFGNDVLNK